MSCSLGIIERLRIDSSSSQWNLCSFSSHRCPSYKSNQPFIIIFAFQWRLLIRSNTHVTVKPLKKTPVSILQAAGNELVSSTPLLHRSVIIPINPRKLVVIQYNPLCSRSFAGMVLVLFQPDRLAHATRHKMRLSFTCAKFWQRNVFSKTSSKTGPRGYDTLWEWF